MITLSLSIGTELVAEGKICDTKEWTTFAMKALGECFNHCKEYSMYIFGRGNEVCGSNKCKCACALKEYQDGKCGMVDDVNYDLYRYTLGD